MMSRIVKLLLGVSLLAGVTHAWAKPLAPPGQARLETPAGEAGAKEDEGSDRITYTVQLPARPLRRVWCTFRGAQRDYTVTFDPSLSDGLSQSISLPKPGSTPYQVRCDAEPAPMVVESKTGEVRSFDLSWRVCDGWTPVGTPIRVVRYRMGHSGASATAIGPGAAEPLDCTSSEPAEKADKKADKKSGEKADEKSGEVISIRQDDALETLAKAARALATSGGGSSGGRSLDDTVPVLVSDTLSLLAEIALERARGRAETLILQPLSRMACDETVPADLEAMLVQLVSRGASPDNPPAVETKKQEADRLTAARAAAKAAAGKAAAWLKYLLPPGQSRLPATCAVIRGRTLAQLAESGAELSDAIGRDLLRLGVRLTHGLAVQGIKDLKLEATAAFVGDALDRATPMLEGMLETRRVPSSVEAQLLLVALASDAAAAVTKGPKGDDQLAVCTAALGFAVAARCHAAGERCDARTLAELVRDRKAYFDLHGCKELDNAPLAWLPEWTARLTTVLAPPAGSGPRDQARTALDLTFELIERIVRPAAVEPVAEAPSKDAKAEEAAKVDEAREQVKSEDAYRRRVFAADMSAGLRGLTLGIVEQDGSQIVAGGLRLLQVLVARARVTLEADKQLQEPDSARGQEITRLIVWLDRGEHTLLRVVRVASALADNARSLELAQADPAQAESQRLARKQTLESLIDAVTDRRWRGEDWVLSLGANTGVLFAPPELRDGGGDAWWALSLASGLAVQKLVPQGGWVGYHFQLTLADLANFLNVEEGEDVVWNDFVVLGAQVALILAPDPDDAFTLGVDFRYLPAGRFARDMQLGVFLSYYVPFLDLN